MKEYICKDDLYKLLNEEVVHVDQVNKCLIKANPNAHRWDEVVLPTITKADIINDFIEDDLTPTIMTIMYCNNKEIGHYVLAKELYHEIDCLLAGLEDAEERGRE